MCGFQMLVDTALEGASTLLPTPYQRASESHAVASVRRSRVSSNLLELVQDPLCVFILCTCVGRPCEERPFSGREGGWLERNDVAGDCGAVRFQELPAGVQFWVLAALHPDCRSAHPCSPITPMKSATLKKVLDSPAPLLAHPPCPSLLTFRPNSTPLQRGIHTIP